MAQDNSKELRPLEERFEESRNARLDRERQWNINLSFFLGEQWLEWDSQTRRLRKPDLPPWRVTSTTNMIMPSIRTEYAKLTRQRPLVAVQPMGSEVNRQTQARISDKIREFLWDKTETFEHFKNALMWTLITGTGFVKTYWDTNIGGNVTDEEGNNFSLGDVAVCAVSPLEIYPDPLAESLDDAAWIFHAKVRSTEWIQRTYGEEVSPEPLHEVKLTGGRLFSAGRISQNADLKNAVVLKEYWERPTQENPQGRYVVFASNKILFDGANPYPVSPIPFVRIRHILIPGSFWGDSTVTSLIDPQMQYNKTRSQAIEIKNMMAKPKWVVPKGSIDRPITTEPGEVIEFIPVGGQRPQIERSPEIPSSIYRELMQLRDEIYELSGQHEVSRAQNPSGVRSGVAIAHLQEQDDLRMNPTVQEYERAVERLETFKLGLARQFYAEPRVARIVGEDGAVDVFTFTSEDIPADADVRVQSGSTLPPSRLARQDFILQLWQLKIVQDPKTVLRLLEFGNINGIYDDENLDTGQAHRENEALQNGEFHNAEDFENHDIHVFEHNRFRKTPEFEQLDENIQQMFREHVAQHEQFKVQAQNPMQPEPQEQGGAPDMNLDQILSSMQGMPM